MRKNFTYQLLASFAFAAGLVHADKITLKDGKVIEGEVISETATEYVISVAYSKSIRTRKTFKRSEIVSIEKEAPDIKPYEALKGILPTADQLKVTAYDQLIDGKVKPFLKNFPNSQHAPEVRKTLETLEAEKARVEAGDVKLQGKWIPASEWNANALELDGQLLVNRMRALAAGRNYRGALIVYEKIKKEFRSTQSVADGGQIALKFLPTYSAQVKKLTAEAAVKLEKREKALAAMGARDATRMKEAYAEEYARHAKAVAAVKESGLKWIPISEYSVKDLKSLQILITAEISSIKRQASRTIDTSTGTMYRKAWEAASAGDAKEVKRAQANLRARRVDDKYIKLITDQLAANPAPEEDKAPTAAELRAAAAAKKAEEDKAKAEKEAADKAAKKAELEKQREAQRLADEENAEPEEESSSILPVIIAVVLLGVLVAFLVMKRKESEE